MAQALGLQALVLYAFLVALLLPEYGQHHRTEAQEQGQHHP
jgi:hypothetical protein